MFRGFFLRLLIFAVMPSCGRFIRACFTRPWYVDGSYNVRALCISYGTFVLCVYMVLRCKYESRMKASSSPCCSFQLPLVVSFLVNCNAEQRQPVCVDGGRDALLPPGTLDTTSGSHIMSLISRVFLS